MFYTEPGVGLRDPFQFNVFCDSVILVEDVSSGWNGMVFQPKSFHDYMMQLVTRC